MLVRIFHSFLSENNKNHYGPLLWQESTRFFIRAIEFNFCNFKNEAISSSIYKL